MSFTDQDKYVLSRIVTAFSTAIVGMCRALEQRQPIMPGPIAEAIHTEVTQLPKGSSGHSVTVKDILTDISKGLDGEPLAKVCFPSQVTECFLYVRGQSHAWRQAVYCPT
jgi:hypothetical protein